MNRCGNQYNERCTIPACKGECITHRPPGSGLETPRRKLPPKQVGQPQHIHHVSHQTLYRWYLALKQMQQADMLVDELIEDIKIESDRRGLLWNPTGKE